MEDNVHGNDFNYVEPRLFNRVAPRGYVYPRELLEDDAPMFGLNPFDHMTGKSASSLQSILDMAIKYAPKSLTAIFDELLESQENIRLIECLSEEVLDTLGVTKEEAQLRILKKFPHALMYVPPPEQTLEMVILVVQKDLTAMYFCNNPELLPKLQEIVRSIDFGQFINGPKSATDE